ncbi:MAG TPA: glycogen debranching protein GlgX, partial [Pseudonocardiaceae bacterium]|nr:glycogen debranching protein GlgX [Pseudonocardiaceae bacterium]
FGATLVPGGVNFSVFSGPASAVTVVLFKQGEKLPMAEIPIPDEFRIGRVWSITVFGLDYEDLEYGYRVTGPEYPEINDRFDATKVLSDPYAQIMSLRPVWGQPSDPDDAYPHRSRLAFDDFDWEDDAPLRIPSNELVVYETHVRGFTRHPSSGVTNPGTYAGLVEKIPYLQELGINCIELLPIFEFDEFGDSRLNQDTGELLLNYWGYNTVSFFAPKAGYAATGRFGMQGDELKHLVKKLHKAGIEIILDVVFNHTAEGNEMGPSISFRGLDNSTYYMMTPDGYYYNFSGTGNTFNSNNPVVRDFIVSCLRFWASQYHIDGFRFDLAAIMDRDEHGVPLDNPPLLEALAHDPVLRDCKLIAEAWDAGGLYQVGSFPNYRRWSEWNGKYRDTVRRFLKGDEGVLGDFATRMVGSPDLYKHRGARASINFLTCHDGFTLADTVAYNDKHNEANGEDNRDGANDNNSWNSGWEGPTDDPEVNRLRARQIRNGLLLLLTSRGIPMILSGDEVGKTQHGNNNAYCHDTELAWFDWTQTETNADLLRFTSNVVRFRAAHPVLHGAHHPNSIDATDCGHPEISWHGVRAWEPDWSPGSRLLGMMWCGHHIENGSPDYVYVVANTHWEGHDVQLPPLEEGWHWRRFADTSLDSPADACEPGAETPVTNPENYQVGPRSVAVMVGYRDA